MSGEMEYQINDAIYKLSAGDGIFGNSNSLHTGRRINGHQCTYLSITFHPRFLYGYENSILQTKYVGFITSNESWASLALKQDVEWQKEILDVIKEIFTHELNSNRYIQFTFIISHQPRASRFAKTTWVRIPKH